MGDTFFFADRSRRRRPSVPRFLQPISRAGFAVLLIGFMLWIAFLTPANWVRSARNSASQRTNRFRAEEIIPAMRYAISLLP